MGYIVAFKDGRKIAFDYGTWGSASWRGHLKHAVKSVFKLPYEHRYFILNKEDYEIVSKDSWVMQGMDQYIGQSSELS